MAHFRSPRMMSFREWQQLSPAEAAAETRKRIQSTLSPAQQRAVFAYLPSEDELTAAFAAADRQSALGGVPYVLKDLFDVATLPTLAGSTFLPEIRGTPATDSAIVTKLRRGGAVLAGKTHLHEFAYGITGENPHFGDCEHPRFPGRTTGGSSSGSAAAVAAGIAPLGIGTDTGGSIRVPAAFCGIYGFRMTPRDEFISDAFPLAPSFDTAGWFTQTPSDMSTVLDVFVSPETSTKKLRGCYLSWPDLDADVAQSCHQAALKFASPADQSTADALVRAFSTAAESYGTVVSFEAWQAHQNWAERFRERYDPTVWQRLQRGRTVTESSYQAAVVHCASVRASWSEFFSTYDFLVLAATPFGALTKAECTLANRNRLIGLTAPASIVGLPVLTVPVTLPSGLTTGLQIIAKDVKSPVWRWALSV